jgi:hypothetical protein
MTLADLRDIAIIILALESIVIGAVLILLLWQLRSLTVLLQEELRPMLESLQKTIGTVKGTTSLVSEVIVSPAVKISGFATGVREALQVLLRFKPPRNRG